MGVPAAAARPPAHSPPVEVDGGATSLDVPQLNEQRLFSIRRAQLHLSHSCTSLCEPPARRKRPRRSLQREHCAAQPQPLAHSHSRCVRRLSCLVPAEAGRARGARAVHAPQPARGESPRARAAVSSCRVPRASRQSVAAVVAAHAQPPMPCASARFRPQRPRATRCSTSTARERARCASTCRRAAACARKRTTFGTPRRTPKPRSAAWSAAAALRHAFRHRRRT